MPEKTKLKNTIYNTFTNKVVLTDIAKGAGYKRDLDFCIAYIQKNYPHIYPYAMQYLHKKISYFNDIYIAKSQYFKEFTSFLFDILFAHEQACDCSFYGIEPIKVSYYLSNILGGIYFYYLENSKQPIKIKRLPVVQFKNVDREVEILPAFSENNVAILIAPNENYLPYAAVLIQSIIENSSADNNYDIILFKTDIVEATKQMLLRQVANYPNFSVRFVDISRAIDNYKNLPLTSYFTIEMYFRIFAPYILKNYEKILYLDTDTIAFKDVAQLYNTNIDSYLVGACYDLLLYGAMLLPEDGFIYQVIKSLNIENAPFGYFNSGVLLMNAAEFRRSYTIEEIMKIPQMKKFELPDQDTLNVLAKDKVYYLDQRWNAFRKMADWQKSTVRMPVKYYKMLELSQSDPYIVHFTTAIKPWNTPDTNFGEYYWKYARKTEFYERIIYKQIENNKKYIEQAIYSAKFSTKFKRKIKKMLMPLVNKFFPKGSDRRKKLKKLLGR